MTSLPFRALDLELSITRTEIPPPVVPNERWIDNAGHLLAWSSQDRLQVAGTGVFCFAGDSRQVMAFVDHDVESTRVQEDFCRFVLPLVLQTRGWQVLHASAVSTPEGVVGFCGRSGAGKSTVARTWATEKHALWADDRLVLRVHNQTPETIRLPEGRTDPQVAGPAGPAQSLLTLVVLEVDDGSAASPTLDRLSPAIALTELLPHALCLDSTSSVLARQLFLTYSDLARRLPIHRLAYRQTPESAEALTAWLEERLIQKPATRSEPAHGR
ncbi:MAG: hypothetical protein GY769_22770 [bacterium]|nr:hypothetical protein [bacterium]